MNLIVAPSEERRHKRAVPGSRPVVPPAMPLVHRIRFQAPLEYPLRQENQRIEASAV